MILTPTGRFGWDPFLEFRRLQNDINRAFAGLDSRQTAAGYPALNLWVSEHSAVVTAELPGIAPNDLDITVRDELLTIQGKREVPTGTEKAAWHRRERGYGSFARTIELPFKVDPDNVQARFQHGVLEIEMHRPEAEKPRKISINAS